jgi:hypothetical protein
VAPEVVEEEAAIMVAEVVADLVEAAVAVAPMEAAVEVTPADMDAKPQNRRDLVSSMAPWKFSDVGGEMKARWSGKSAPGVGRRI